MAGDLNEKLEKILQNPDSLKKIAEIASSLGTDGGQISETPPENEKSNEAISKGFAEITKRNDTANLLSALKPFVSPGRRSKIDKMITVSTVIKLLKH